MKISQVRSAKLYAAISDPVMDLRLKVYRDSGLKLDAQKLDSQLFDLELEIWTRVKAALEIEDR